MRWIFFTIKMRCDKEEGRLSNKVKQAPTASLVLTFGIIQVVRWCRLPLLPKREPRAVTSIQYVPVYPYSRKSQRYKVKDSLAQKYEIRFLRMKMASKSVRTHDIMRANRFLRSVLPFSSVNTHIKIICLFFLTHVPADNLANLLIHWLLPGFQEYLQAA